MKILLTGSTGDLGSVITENLLKQGHQVTGISLKNRQKATELAQFGTAQSTIYSHHFLDLSDLTQLEKFLKKTNLEEYDAVILTHGIHTLSNMLTITEEEIIDSLKINAISSFIITQGAVAAWSQKDPKDRTVTYISSVATETASPEELPYHAAKEWMVQALKTFTRAYTKNKIRFNVISPGLMETSAGLKLLETRPDVTTRIPLGRLVSLNEIATLIDTILKSPSITGQNIHINNGRYNTI